MRVFLYIWMIVQLVLLVTGGVWTFIDWKNEKRKKTPMILMESVVLCWLFPFWFYCQ